MYESFGQESSPNPEVAYLVGDIPNACAAAVEAAITRTPIDLRASSPTQTEICIEDVTGVLVTATRHTSAVSGENRYTIATQDLLDSTSTTISTGPGGTDDGALIAIGRRHADDLGKKGPPLTGSVLEDTATYAITRLQRGTTISMEEAIAFRERRPARAIQGREARTVYESIADGFSHLLKTASVQRGPESGIAENMASPTRRDATDGLPIGSVKIQLVNLKRRHYAAAVIIFDASPFTHPEDTRPLCVSVFQDFDGKQETNVTYTLEDSEAPEGEAPPMLTLTRAERDRVHAAIAAQLQASNLQ